MIYQGTLAIIDTVLDKHERAYTDDCKTTIARMPIPVVVDRTEQAIVGLAKVVREKDKLIYEIELLHHLDKPIVQALEKMTAVLCGTVLESSPDRKYFKKVKIHSVLLTPFPADERLAPLGTLKLDKQPSY